MSFPLLTRSALLTEPPRRGAIDSRRLRHRSKRSVSPTFPLWLSPPSIYPVFHSISVGSSLARNALTERQPQSEKKAARARPMSAKAVVVLCATSFFVGMLLSGRMTLLVPPTGGDGEVSSGHGSRLSLFSDDCEHRRKLDEGNPNDIMNEVSRTHQAIQSLDKSVSSLEMELAVERAKQNGGLGAAVPSKGRLPKALVVVGINTAFSSKKRRDSLRDTWVPRGDGLRRLEEEKGVVVRFVIGHSATPGGALDRAIDVEDAETRDFMRLDHVEGYHELSSKTRTYFTAAVATWDADFYVKVDDDVHVNLGMLASRLARYRTRPRVYVGCMKSGPVLSQKGVKYHEPEYWKFGDEGNRYFRHATGQIYAISKDLASYISINQLDTPVVILATIEITCCIWILWFGIYACPLFDQLGNMSSVVIDMQMK
ncbi:probable beta-1,3-galactosyltransferase 8 isoform X2 [Oryza brachyantha]|uniref:probable beta-1,3-galactosyltransferase 8 isoform X2 n=1 Tax=Oryza brachyantha TaxID=4533 RepID=UPI00077686D9|nr:probable beta-1,3-galactosyltransferase 8 isoform X2 [Oryza brachyantha]